MVSFKLYFHEIELHRTVFNCSILHEVQCWRTSDCILLTGSSCCICRPAVRAGQCWLVAGIDHSPPSLAPLPAVCQDLPRRPPVSVTHIINFLQPVLKSRLPVALRPARDKWFCVKLCSLQLGLSNRYKFFG